MSRACCLLLVAESTTISTFPHAGPRQPHDAEGAHSKSRAAAFERAMVTRAASITRRHQIQSEYWAGRALSRKFSCWCCACSSGSVCSVTSPVFSEDSGEKGVEEAL